MYRCTAFTATSRQENVTTVMRYWQRRHHPYSKNNIYKISSSSLQVVSIGVSLTQKNNIPTEVHGNQIVRDMHTNTTVCFFI